MVIYTLKLIKLHRFQTFVPALMTSKTLSRGSHSIRKVCSIILIRIYLLAYCSNIIIRMYYHLDTLDQGNSGATNLAFFFAVGQYQHVAQESGMPFFDLKIPNYICK